MMMIERRPLMTAGLLAALLAATPAFAQPAAPQPAPVTVENAWTRATAPGAKIGVLFLTLTSAAGDRLTGVSSPVAGRGEIHEMSMDGSVMRMRELPGGLALPAGKAVTLAPSGLHIMLMDLVGPLKQGQTIRVHLTFASSPAVDVEASVGAIGAAKMPSRP